MLEIIDKYKSIVFDFSIENIESKDTSVVKIRIKLFNNDKLSVFELDDIPTKHHKYGYQWMDFENNLIRRWDNAPHHSHIPTYPFHQHIGSEENVHPSEEMNLEKVLDFIGKNIY